MQDLSVPLANKKNNLLNFLKGAIEPFATRCILAVLASCFQNIVNSGLGGANSIY